MNTTAMKQQTIGVEIEMNNITRDYACEVVAKYFGTSDTVAYTHATDGYRTWSCYDAQGRKWKFSKDVSIRGYDDEKCEMVTPILTYADIPMLQEVVRQLRHAGAKSDASRGCGVHIHVGVDGHSAKSLRILANLMARHEDLLTSALNLDRDRMSQYCQPVDPEFVEKVNAKKPKTMDELADVWYEAHHANWDRTGHYNSSRYHMLNLHSVFTKGTVEFRLFQFDMPNGDRKGGLHAGQLKSWIQWVLAISQTAKEARSASPKKVQMDNPKYAMAGWLCSMELTGEEYKTLRDFFTRNLAGNTGRRYVA